MRFLLNMVIGISCIVSPLVVLTQSPVLMTRFPNPTPATNDYFSWSVAALGSDRVLIGAISDDNAATNGGAAYLFHTNGALLTTFSNPNPAYTTSIFPGVESGDQFGYSIAPLGLDRVLVGAPFNDGEFCCAFNGTVYVFNTNGSLLATIHNPHIGNAEFGTSVAAVGSDRLIIGAPQAGPDPDMPFGEAYLMDTNGGLLTTFYNPNPQNFAQFGFSTAAFGTERVLIGSRSLWMGSASLFRTDGALLTTFTNPAPSDSDWFGHTVAAVGDNRVLIGAPQADLGALDAGVAYLFGTNGTLLTTFTNPTPAAGDAFGARVAVLGSDRVVIVASRDDTTTLNGGIAYLFNTSGALLTILTNPTPAVDDYFGTRVAALGAAHVLLGALYDDLGAADAGVAYLFTVPATPAPLSLTIQRTPTNTVIVSWPSASTGFVLQQNTNGLSSVNWSNITTGIQTDGTTKTLMVNPTGPSQFYRLTSP